MILLIDLANDSIRVSVTDKRKHLFILKCYADKMKSESEYIQTFSQFLSYHNLDVSSFEGAILSSVVPLMTKRIQFAVEKLLKKKCYVISKEVKTGLSIRMDNPSEVGSNLIVSAIGAIDDYFCDCLIINLSSVLSFSIVTDKKEFLGGALFPGLRNSVETMWSNSAQLMDIELENPKRYIGKSTKESMNNGIVYGYAKLIESISEEMIKEYKKPLKKILTGNDANIIKDSLSLDYILNENLTFDGLYDVYERNLNYKGK